MTENITRAQAIEDFAGAYYRWFYSVTVEGDTLKVEGNTDYIGDDTLRAEATLTDADLLKAAQDVEKLSGGPDTDYEGLFLSDFIKGDFEYADGDANIVDCILQQAMWGEIVFG